MASLLNTLEDTADGVLRTSRHVIPILARVCIVGTFIEDGLRLLTQVIVSIKMRMLV